MSPRLSRADARRAHRLASFGVLSSLALALGLGSGLSGCASPASGPRDAAAPAATAGTENASGARSAPTSGSPTARPTAPPTALVWVNGMGCPLCANNVDQQLKSVPGVENVTINLGTGLVQVALSATAPPTEAQLATAVENTGFTLVSIQMPGATASPASAGSSAAQNGAPR